MWVCAAVRPPALDVPAGQHEAEALIYARPEGGAAAAGRNSTTSSPQKQPPMVQQRL